MAPVRTCIGCRMRSTTSDLLRLVVTVNGPERTVTPDPQGTAPGRGAHLHPTPACLALAERRRAFVRALRVQAPLDTGPVRDHVEAMPTTPPGKTPGDVAREQQHPRSAARSGTTRKRSSRS